VTTAFVLSGGGSLGAVQVGMLQALAARGIKPDLLVGSSAGALNAAFVAGRGFDDATLAELAGVWQGLRRQDVFPFAPHRHMLALAGARPSLCAPHGLLRLIDSHVGYERLEDARIPVHVVATDVLSGREVLLSRGDVVTAVLASASIPAVLPAVEIDGRTLFDGGIANNTPISQAVALGADRVVVLPAGVACALPTPPRSALATAVHAITLLIEQRLVLDTAAYGDRAELVVLPPLCPLSVSSADFRHAALLIERARDATAAWLDAGRHRLPHPERFLSLHHHSLVGHSPVGHSLVGQSPVGHSPVGTSPDHCPGEDAA
jgi:NTE family protein